MNSKIEKSESGMSMIFNLLFNLVVPVTILTKYSDDSHLGRVNGLLIALAFPLSFGLYELIKSKKLNWISILGLVSVLLTGGLALIKLSKIWFAVKEAIIPLIIGLAVIVTGIGKKSMLKSMLLNPKVFKLDEIMIKVKEFNAEVAFEQLLKKATLLFASSFFLSSILNFVLAIVVLKNPVGSEEFNRELGQMAALSYVVIMLPCIAVIIGTIYYFFNRLHKITGLKMEEVLNTK